MLKVILIVGISSILFCILIIILSYIIMSKIMNSIENAKELDFEKTNNQENHTNES